jgi:hypothetical protein
MTADFRVIIHCHVLGPALHSRGKETGYQNEKKDTAIHAPGDEGPEKEQSHDSNHCDEKVLAGGLRHGEYRMHRIAIRESLSGRC